MEESNLLFLNSLNLENEIKFISKKTNPFYNPILIITYQDILELALSFLGKLFLNDNESPKFKFENKAFNIFFFMQYHLYFSLFLVLKYV